MKVTPEMATPGGIPLHTLADFLMDKDGIRLEDAGDGRVKMIIRSTEIFAPYVTMEPAECLDLASALVDRAEEIVREQIRRSVSAAIVTAREREADGSKAGG